MSEITKDYVKGYSNAVETTHTMITGAVQRSNHPVKILDEIIASMYKQQEEVKEFTDNVEEQTPETFIKELLSSTEGTAFTITIDGKLGGR